MFCEAFAYEGNWILGRFFEEEHDEIVEEMSIYTNFMLKNARYFEGQRKKNSVGVLYCDQGMLEDGDRHYSYLGLCQALAELNIQYDTIFTGNELFGFDDIDMGDPADYQAILLPMANSFTVAQTRTLAKLAATGRNIVIYGPDASQLPEAPNITRYGDLGLEFMNSFLDEQRDRIRKTLPASFKPLVEEVADSSVKAVFYEKEELECCVLHLINYDYVSESDMIKKKENLEVTLQLPSAYAAAKHALILAPGQEEVKIDLGRTGMQATFQVPGLETYALIVFNKP